MEGGKQRRNNQISHLAPGSSIAGLLLGTTALPWLCRRSGRRDLCGISSPRKAAHSPQHPLQAGWQVGGLLDHVSCTHSKHLSRANQLDPCKVPACRSSSYPLKCHGKPPAFFSNNPCVFSLDSFRKNSHLADPCCAPILHSAHQS